MVDMATLKARNAERWAEAKIQRNFVSVAKSLCAAKRRYLIIEKYTGVPWFVVAVIHEREADQRWDANLAQGDPWNKVSVNVPKGRGPFQSWEAAAIDALIHCSPYAANNHDWTVGGTLTLLEEYNGLGYASKDLPSPYIWSGTDQYIRGKYDRDGHFNPKLVDAQLGCAGLLIAMQSMDSTIVVGGKRPISKHSTAGTSGEIVVSTPKTASILAILLDWIKSLFRR